MKTKSKIQNPESQIETPKYYLADVPHAVRSRALELCIKRHWHEALELLRQRGFRDYTLADLYSFYDWAPSRLIPDSPERERTPECPRDYDQPSAEQLEDIRKRLADVPVDVLERVHDTLRQGTIEQAGSLLWHAGAGFTSADLYEYRKTLFPPNSMVDPYTAGPPLLRQVAEKRESGRAGEREKEAADDSQQLAESRQRLLQLLSARARDGSADSLSAAQPTTHDEPPSTQFEDEDEQADNEQATAPVQSLAPIDPVALLDSLRSLLTRYVVLPDMAAEALALWVVHTYAFQLRQVTTYIGVVSPEKRCGKTTLLELLGLLANRSLTAANISPSALFRVIQETSPTLLIDEADTFLQGRDELAGILNAGYRKGNAYVVRLSDSRTRRSMDHREPEFGEWTQDYADDFAQYSCWCPKVMAAIGRLPDTLADRCIVIAMQRKMPAEKCERMRHLNATEYRMRCAEFVAAHSDAIANAQPDIPPTLNDRAADIWEPLLAIADLAGGEWPELARQAALKLSGADEDITILGYFLADLRAWMLHEKVDRMLSRDIVAAFNPCHSRPWEDLRRGREINEYWLGHKMRELGIRSRSMRVGDVNAKGYTLEDIEGACRRYLPSKAEASAKASKKEESGSETGALKNEGGG
ncbi:MAG TPA: DUF3631 domain-containing protein [Verrucomicrobiae bacterium]|nr:DUF3631 domain-containing protein [Verrucomicrobiae bacterium]